MNINKINNAIQFEQYKNIKDPFQWRNISKKKLTESFIKKFGNKLCWSEIVKYNTSLSEQTLQKFFKKIIYAYEFPTKTDADAYVNEIEHIMYNLNKNPNLTEEFIAKNIKEIYARALCNMLKHKFFSENFIKTYLFENNGVNTFREYILKYQKISENFLEQQYIQTFSKYNFCWDYLSQNKQIQFSKEFLLKYKNNLNWNWITRYQNCIFESVENFNLFKDKIKFNKIKYRKFITDNNDVKELVSNIVS